MRLLQYSTQNPGDIFILGASAAFTQELYNTGEALKGNSIASWLLGTPSSGSVNYNVFPIYQFPYIAPWAQFDWKVSRKLTINASESIGLPTAVDDDVILGLIQLTKMVNNFTSREVEFSRLDFIKLLGWPDSGDSYRRLSVSHSAPNSILLRSAYVLPS